MPSDSIRRIRIIGVIVAATLFVLSLGCCTLLYADDSSFLVGLACLLFGMSYVAWYANPFLFFSGCLLLEGKPRWALATGLIATALMLTTFSITQIERNEAGTLAPVLGYGAGFFLWLGCGLALLVTSLACLVIDERPAVTASAEL